VAPPAGLYDRRIGGACRNKNMGARMSGLSTVRWWVGLAGLALCGAASAQPPAPPSVNLPKAGAPLTLSVGRQQIRVSLVADGLTAPWDLVFIPGTTDLLVTESNGKLRMIQGGKLLPDPVWTPPSPTGNDILHGVVVHPDFATNRLVYVTYLKGDDQRQTLGLSRGRLEGAKLVAAEEIFVADAWENARMAYTGRMEFGPDKTLYVSVGDRDRLCCGRGADDNSIRMRAQSLADHTGKILRLKDDGTAPADNPFVGRAGAKPEIFTYGHRNSYGLRFHPVTGELWQMEIGPQGGDEVNILKPGANYGWPLVSTGRNYSGTLVSDQAFHRDGMEDPVIFWVPQISPAAMAFYTGDKFPQWQNSLIIGALSGQHVERMPFNDKGQPLRREEFLSELGVRFRDVEIGPDGYVYFSTEVRYGSGQPDGAIIRLEPAPAQ
jgi:glucose/arabinose dehydrogenase